MAATAAGGAAANLTSAATLAASAPAAYIGAMAADPSNSAREPGFAEVIRAIEALSAKLETAVKPTDKPPWFKRPEIYALGVSVVTLIILTFGVSDRFNEVNRRVASLETAVSNGFTAIRQQIADLDKQHAVDEARRSAAAAVPRDHKR